MQISFLWFTFLFAINPFMFCVYERGLLCRYLGMHLSRQDETNTNVIYPKSVRLPHFAERCKADRSNGPGDKCSFPSVVPITFSGERAVWHFECEICSAQCDYWFGDRPEDQRHAGGSHEYRRYHQSGRFADQSRWGCPWRSTSGRTTRSLDLPQRSPAGQKGLCNQHISVIRFKKPIFSSRLLKRSEMEPIRETVKFGW
jgi:hypothetical protein